MAGGTQCAPRVSAQHVLSPWQPRTAKVDHLGLAVWRYTEWAAFPCGDYLHDPMNCTESSEPRWDELMGVELYSVRTS